MRLSYYPKIHRFPIHEFGVKGFYRLPNKYYWDVKTSKLILGEGRKYIKEKLDGNATSIYRGKYQLFVESLKEKQLIPYTHLTNLMYVFDVWDTKENRFLQLDELLYVCEEHSMEVNPVILTTEEPIPIKHLVNLLKTPSRFNPDHPAEGYIIVNDTIRLIGKIINQAYDAH